MSLQAVIMAGGEGARLRPLTCETPKPMLPILGRPVLSYALELLRKHDLLDVCATLQYLSDRVTRHFGSGFAEGVRLRYSLEREPLGTAGGVLRAAGDARGTLVVLSGDGLTDIDLGAALRFHKERGAMATMALTRVSDPLAYGVVIADENGRVKRFVEKPGWSEVYADTVNTGIYLLEPEALRMIPEGAPYDFGRDLFPRMVREGKPVYGYLTDAYWCDVGDLAAYIRAQADLLSGRVRLDAGTLIAKDAVIDPSARIETPVYLGAGARVEAGAEISSCAVIGANARVGTNARVARSVLGEGAALDRGARAYGAVICRGATLGTDAQASEGSVVGDFAVIGARARIEPNVKVYPGKRVEANLRVTENLVWGGGARLRVGAWGAAVSTLREASALAAAWAEVCEIGEHNEVAVAYVDDARAEALYHAALSALIARGVSVQTLGETTPPVLRQAQRLLGTQNGLFAEAGRLRLFGEGGSALHRSVQRKIESIAARQEAPPFTREIGKTIPVADAEALYIGAVATPIWEETRGLVKPHLAAFCETEKLAHLARRAFRAAGFPARATVGEGCLEPWETGFWLTDERAVVFDPNDRPAEAQQTLLAYIASGAREWIAPIDAPAVLETLAEANGCAVTRVSSAPEALASALLEADAKQFDLHFDGIFRALRIGALLAKRGTTLRGLLETLPACHLHAESVPCALPLRGRLLRHLAEAEPGAALSGGLRVSREEGAALLDPSEERDALLVCGEAATMEAARELCDFYVMKVRDAMEAMGK